MGFSYRKSFKAGPIRITASKSGVSYSAGVKGARVTKRADGRVQTTLSAPGTGLRYTSTSGGKQKKGRSTVAGPAPAPGISLDKAPTPPAPGTPPLSFKGHLATITLQPDRIQITRKFLGKITGNRDQTIAWQNVIAVDFRDPDMAINGHIHFVHPGDPRGLTATGRGDHLAAAARQPHAIMFTWQQRKRYQELRDMLIAASAQAVNQAAGAPHRDSISQDLARLHQLLQVGALTQAEFEQAKARLLAGG